MDKNLKLGNDDTTKHDVSYIADIKFSKTINAASFRQVLILHQVDDEVALMCSTTRMLTWNRTGNHVAMYLSDGTLQVNFWDHSKINVSNIHRKSSMKITCKSPVRMSLHYLNLK